MKLIHFRRSPSRAGQSLMEYVLTIGIVLAAVVATAMYIFNDYLPKNMKLWFADSMKQAQSTISKVGGGGAAPAISAGPGAPTVSGGSLHLPQGVQGSGGEIVLPIGQVSAAGDKEAKRKPPCNSGDPIKDRACREKGTSSTTP